MCKCRCIDKKAGSAGAPGVAKCNFEAQFTIEAALPCDGTDVIVDFGGHCFPMTTSSTIAVIEHADFSTSEIGPVAENGLAARQCDDFQALMNSGEVLVGQVPAILGPEPRDLILSLRLPCASPPPP